MTNARQKGARGERDAADHLTQLGYPAERSARNGVRGASDLICPALEGVHIEVKRNEDFDIGTAALSHAMEQAERDAGDRLAVVLWRRNRVEWRVTFRLGGIMLTAQSTAQSWAMIQGASVARRRVAQEWKPTAITGNVVSRAGLPTGRSSDE